jgi:hypothetical protein
MNDSFNNGPEVLTDFRTGERSENVVGRFRHWLRLFSSGTLGQVAPVPAVPGYGIGTGSHTESDSRKGTAAKYILALLLAGGVFGLIWFSLQLAAMRIYQVDECMEVWVARTLATAPDKAAAGHVTLLQIILSWILPHASRSSELLASARLVMVVIFWVNWMLIALATGERLLSRRWLMALAGAATLAPLWDYGFEVRHDNLLLAGVLLMWCAVRFQPPGLRSYFFVGAMTAVLEFVAFKAFVYTLPIFLAILIFPRPGSRQSRWKLALALTAGGMAACLIVRVTFGMTGLWDLYLAGFNCLSVASTDGRHFGPGGTLSRLLGQTPLLLAVVMSGLIAIGADVFRRGKAALNWDGCLPEALLFLGSFVALLINPAPFPYNLLHLVPYAFLFAFRYGASVCKTLSDRPVLYPIAAAVLIFAHLVPFGLATRRHLDFPNIRQEGLMSLAEDLTDPVKDPVYDAIGMVSTRPIVDSRAFLHSLYFKSFINGPGPQVRDFLAARPAAVLIPSYRTDWLPEKDKAFIRERYVTLTDDFLVLGSVLPKGGGTFEIVHAGRYRVSLLETSDLVGSYPEGFGGLIVSTNEPILTGTLDGKPVASGAMELSVGTHRIACDGGAQPAVVWVGPILDRLPRLGGGDHRQLFFNWY